MAYSIALHIQFTWLEIFKETQLHNSLLVHLEGYNIYIYITIRHLCYDNKSYRYHPILLNNASGCLALNQWIMGGLRSTIGFEGYDGWLRWMMMDGLEDLFDHISYLKVTNGLLEIWNPKKKEKMLITIIDHAPTTQHDWDPFLKGVVVTRVFCFFNFVMLLKWQLFKMDLVKFGNKKIWI